MLVVNKADRLLTYRYDESIRENDGEHVECQETTNTKPLILA